MIDTRLAPYAALLLRLTMGVAFVAHALFKVMVFGMAGTAQFFEMVGFPGLLAYPVVLGELFGGIALIVGFQVRAVSLLLIPTMLGALMTHWPNGWVFSNENGGWEYPAFWIVTLVVQAMLGAGPAAIRVPQLPEIGGPAAARS